MPMDPCWWISHLWVGWWICISLETEARSQRFSLPGLLLPPCTASVPSPAGASLGIIIWSGGMDPVEDVVSVVRQEPVEGVLELVRKTSWPSAFASSRLFLNQCRPWKKATINTTLLSSLSHSSTSLFPSIFSYEPFFPASWNFGRSAFWYSTQTFLHFYSMLLVFRYKLVLPQSSICGRVFRLWIVFRIQEGQEQDWNRHLFFMKSRGGVGFGLDQHLQGKHLFL